MAYAQNLVFPRMIELAACLCNQLQEDGLPEPCFCGVLPGESAAWEQRGSCGPSQNGMAYVRLSTTYPSETVGVASQQTGNCSVGLGWDVEMAVLRSVPVLRSGASLSAQQQAELVELQIADMMAMRKAISCCLSGSSKDWILGAYLPVGPMGGVVGGGMTIYLAA
jgi:hypothetical protein